MLKILIVDDEPDICELIHKLIDWEALKMTSLGSSQNGIDAMEIILRQKPDIVITDIQMPGMDGMETAKMLRHDNEDMILIFVTAAEEYVFQAFDVAAFHYLSLIHI